MTSLYTLYAARFRTTILTIVNQARRVEISPPSPLFNRSVNNKIYSSVAVYSGHRWNTNVFSFPRFLLLGGNEVYLTYVVFVRCLTIFKMYEFVNMKIREIIS